MISRLIGQKFIIAICGTASVASAVVAYLVWVGPKQETPERKGPDHKATRRAKNTPVPAWFAGTTPGTR
ncbi:MAG: hypothetical protein H7308_18825 [Chthonomonadaceae bacterium]|nr:hypothetical protein [Chthonomonadaceae bacterium]